MIKYLVEVVMVDNVVKMQASNGQNGQDALYTRVNFHLDNAGIIAGGGGGGAGGRNGPGYTTGNRNY